MTQTIAVLSEAAERGLTLSINGKKLRVTPGERLTPEFHETLSRHKWRLLAILQLPFVMAYSKTLEETIFLCGDEATREALVEAGAEPFSIYTRDELRILVDHNRARPFIPSELCKLHESRKTFNGRIRTWRSSQ